MFCQVYENKDGTYINLSFSHLDTDLSFQLLFYILGVE